MNKNTKKVVYKILENDPLAREDDWYLIQQTLIEMLPCNQGTAFGKVLQGMRCKGISFEAITRQRRKFLEENPSLKEQKATIAREKEQQDYFIKFRRN